MVMVRVGGTSLAPFAATSAAVISSAAEALLARRLAVREIDWRNELAKPTPRNPVALTRLTRAVSRRLANTAAIARGRHTGAPAELARRPPRAQRDSAPRLRLLLGTVTPTRTAGCLSPSPSFDS